MPATREELLAERTQLVARQVELNEQYGLTAIIDPASADGQEFSAASRRVDEIDRTVAQYDFRTAEIARLAGVPENTDQAPQFMTVPPGATRGQDIWDLTTIRSNVSNPEQANHELRERASHAIELAKFPHPDVDEANAKAHMTRLLTSINDPAAFAKHMLVTGSPVYSRAFGKALLGQHLQAQEMQALSLGGSSGAEGGYAVPVTLDPTIIPISSGVVNPLRQISRTIQISTKTWEGVTATAVTAYRGDESSEATEATPTLAQPTATPGRVSAWIAASFEIAQDWGALQSELAMLIADAKDTEESTAFVTGAGTGTANNAVPQGIITGATITVSTAGTATIASTDFDLLEQALPVRWQANASVLASRATYNLVRHFDSSGGPDYWLSIAQSLGSQGGRVALPLHGYPTYEASSMSAVHTSNALVMVLGDFSKGFVIVDRIGMSIELVPHLFGANRLPTGQRGFYAFWRNTSKVIIPTAFRVLKVL